MAKSTKLWFLKDFDLFKKIDRHTLMSMSEKFKMINSKKGDVLKLSQEEGPLVYFIKVGAVKIISIRSGHVRSVLNRGNIFGETAIYEDRNHTDEAEAIVLEDSLICLITVTEMKMMIESTGTLKNQLLKLYGFRIRKLQNNLEQLLYKDSETRIKEYIFHFIEEFGYERNGRYVAKNLLSHKDIAHLTNTSRQTVSNVMSKLRKNGLIDYNSKEIYYTQGNTSTPKIKSS